MSLLNKRFLMLITAPVILGALIPVAFAETVTSKSFDKSTYYQGDNGTYTISVRNDHSYQICTKSLSLQFDWQQANNQAWISSDKPCIATGNSFTFSVQFNIPAATSVGSHGYSVVWQDAGFLLGTQTLDQSLIPIHDAQELVYTNTAPSVQAKISQYQGMNFRSTTAVADLTQAISLSNQATTLANQGQWSQAVTDLNQASSLANQAYAAEQTYEAGQAASISSASSQSSAQAASSQTNLIYGAVAVVVVLAIGGVVATRRRKKA